MEQDTYQVAREKYASLIPGDCFLYKVPLWLRHVQDHTVFPSSQLRASGGFKWMKVSRFEDFLKNCKAFAVEQGANSILRVLVMPYMPPRDASSMLQNLLLIQPPTIDVDHEEEGVGPWDMRTGTAWFVDLGLKVEVVVMNFGLLRSKAKLYNLVSLHFNAMINRINKFGEDLKSFLEPFPDDHVNALIYASNQARVNLVFAMVDVEEDPHNVILELFQEMHNRIYQDTCVHCDQAIDYADELDPPETLERLKVELDLLGFQQHAVGSLTVQQAQLEVIATLGELEHCIHLSDMHDVRVAHLHFVEKAQQAITDRNALSLLSVLGVKDGR